MNELFDAIQQDNLPLVKSILSEENIINKKVRGITALMFGAKVGVSKYIAELLLDYGADITLKEARTGKDAFMMAVESGNIGLAKMMIDHGADVNISDKYGFTPLMVACAFIKAEALIEFLIQNGAQVTMVNNHGQTAGDISRLNSTGYEKILQTRVSAYSC